MQSRNVVGVYDRPHPLKRRQVWLPLAIGVTTLAVWLAFFVIW